jgi:NAD+ synthase (glutamine-hydrolysing)
MVAVERSFFDLYAQGFVRVAIAVPRVALADPARNGSEIRRLYARAAQEGAALALFPELSLSGYSLDDLHQQEALLQSVEEELAGLAGETATRSTVLVVGAPLRVAQRLYNVAAVLHRGRVLGVVPKTYLPNYREFYEPRQFASGRRALAPTARVLGEDAPFGNDLVFRANGDDRLAFHVEICEDVWVPIPPSTYAAFAGATLLANLSASNITIGKASYRQLLCASQSAKTLSAHLYSASGSGESTTDLAWDGHALVYENGELLAESERFADRSQLVLADVDLDRLVQERMRLSSFAENASDHEERVARLRSVSVDFVPPAETVRMRRRIEPRPFAPSDPARRDERCFEAYEIQVTALVQRLRATSIERVAIGVSGGLDSTQALLVCAQAMDRLGLSRENVLAYTMPGFATSQASFTSARELMRALRVSAMEIDIRPSCEQMLRDIGHPYARGEPVYDVTFENVQAGERTSHLFRLANQNRALVVGTGDLSELALGWCTYGVGDQMSHYAVNVSVPKTLMRYLVAWVAERETNPATAAVLRRILETPPSPELVPQAEGSAPQSTEATIGPYELHDFFLYYATRRGYSPAKILYLALCAWSSEAATARPGPSFPSTEIAHWLEVFLRRFFGESQFKRSAIPNGPKVGSGGSLSPRGDWRAPSDAPATTWLAALERAKAWMLKSS